MLKITGNITIIGDIHGQYIDLLKVLDRTNQMGADDKILFLGDYVDRGINSVEVITLLMLMKLNRPNDIFMLRGNH